MCAREVCVCACRCMCVCKGRHVRVQGHVCVCVRVGACAYVRIHYMILFRDEMTKSGGVRAKEDHEKERKRARSDSDNDSEKRQTVTDCMTKQSKAKDRRQRETAVRTCHLHFAAAHGNVGRNTRDEGAQALVVALADADVPVLRSERR